MWIDPSYGWDLVTTYGQVSVEFGQPIDFNPPGGSGIVTNPDGSVYDGYGNMIKPPGSDDPLNPDAGATPTTTYGIPTPFYNGTLAPPSNPEPDDPYTFWDIGGACLASMYCVAPV